MTVHLTMEESLRIIRAMSTAQGMLSALEMAREPLTDSQRVTISTMIEELERAVFILCNRNPEIK